MQAPGDLGSEGNLELRHVGARHRRMKRFVVVARWPFQFVRGGDSLHLVMQDALAHPSWRRRSRTAVAPLMRGCVRCRTDIKSYVGLHMFQRYGFRVYAAPHGMRRRRHHLHTGDGPIQPWAVATLRPRPLINLPWQCGLYSNEWDNYERRYDDIGSSGQHIEQSD